MTSLNLRFGDHAVRVACDSWRGVRKLKASLADHVDDGLDDAPLAFVLTAPAGLIRTHHLVDRMGFVLSQARGLDSGLHALASHLTAFLSPPPGTVRIRARALMSADRIIVCLFPLLSVPPIDERALAHSGLAVVDRLALDVDIATGTVIGVPIPWPALAKLRPSSDHLGAGRSGAVAAVIEAAPAGSPAATRAAVVAKLAGARRTATHRTCSTPSSGSSSTPNCGRHRPNRTRSPKR